MKAETALAILATKAPRARIERLRRHAALAPVADELEARRKQLDRRNKLAVRALGSAIQDAEYRAQALDVAPALQRDRALQASKRKPRRPAVDEWITARLGKNLDETFREMWAAAPGWVTDQQNDGIGLHAFLKRVTKIRKRRM